MVKTCKSVDTKARGYAYAKIEYVIYIAYVRICQKIEYAYDTFHTLN